MNGESAPENMTPFDTFRMVVAPTEYQPITRPSTGRVCLTCSANVDYPTPTLGTSQPKQEFSGNHVASVIPAAIGIEKTAEVVSAVASQPRVTADRFFSPIALVRVEEKPTGTGSPFPVVSLPRQPFARYVAEESL